MDRHNPPSAKLRTYRRSRAPRLPGFDYSSDVPIHLTLCAAQGVSFGATALAEIICENVEYYCTKLGFELYGYCLMPDHLHVLLSPAGSGRSMMEWLQAFKSFTGHEYARLGHSPPLWQRSAHDHVCRKSEAAEDVLRYLAENPVRAGLVECWTDWPWTNVLVGIQCFD
ncbi:MAG: transposase [Phycisphaerae bacterium]